MGYVTKIHKHRGGDRMCVEGELKITKGGKLIIDDDNKEIDVGERVNRLTEEIESIKEGCADDASPFVVTFTGKNTANLTADKTVEEIIDAFFNKRITVLAGLNIKNVYFPYIELFTLDGVFKDMSHIRFSRTYADGNGWYVDSLIYNTDGEVVLYHGGSQ